MQWHQCAMKIQAQSSYSPVPFLSLSSLPIVSQASSPLLVLMGDAVMPKSLVDARTLISSDTISVCWCLPKYLQTNADSTPGHVDRLEIHTGRSSERGWRINKKCAVSDMIYTGGVSAFMMHLITQTCTDELAETVSVQDSLV